MSRRREKKEGNIDKFVGSKCDQPGFTVSFIDNEIGMIFLFLRLIT